MTVTYTLSWAAAAQIIAKITAADPGQDADVHWSFGDNPQMPADPKERGYSLDDVMKWKFDGDPPRRTSACILSAYLEHQAEHLGGTLKIDQDGLWSPMDEVIA